MSTSIISRAGVRMPGIIYGTAWKAADTERLVTLAIGQGFRGIDTACQPKHYNEPGVGEGIAACLGSSLTRTDLYVQTKFTSVSDQDPASIPYDKAAPLAMQVTGSFAVSLRNLRTNYIDGLVLHGPLPTMRGTLEVWRAMESLVDQGVVHKLGISNCYQPGELEALHRAARVKPTIVQNRFYSDTGYDREIRAFCHVHDIVYQSFWTLTANPRLLSHPSVITIATTHGRTPAQILFRYLNHICVVPLTGTRSETHMREDLAIFGFELTPADRSAIDALL